MARVYISFLGTTDYQECHYFGAGFETAKPVRFVQEATVLANCTDWGSEDRIVIFTTEEAAKKNWRNNGHTSRQNGQIQERKGLQTCLASLGLSVPFCNKPIPEGHTEDQVWQIFEKVFDELKMGDEVVFDITHAFRSIPMLAIVILQYAKILRKVSLKGIYYGAFEALGQDAKEIPIQNRKAPIVDLTALNNLMDWSIATDRFLESGDVKSAGALARAGVQGILKESRGQNKAAQTIKNLGASLERFSKMLSTCRGPEISSAALDLKEKAHKCRDLELPKPFRPLFENLCQRLDSFTGNTLKDGMAAAKWCADHNLIQQGYTILEEILLSYVVSGIGDDPLDETLRNIASQSYAIVNQKLSDCPSEWKADAGDNRETARKMIQFIVKHKDLEQTLQKIREKRNDLNHAGFGKAKITLQHAGRFAEALHSLIAETGGILANSSR